MCVVGGIVAGSLGLSENSGKTSHTISLSFLNSFSMRGGRVPKLVYVLGEVTEVHVVNIFVDIDFQDLFSNLFDCGRFLKE